MICSEKISFKSILYHWNEGIGFYEPTVQSDFVIKVNTGRITNK